MYICSEAAAALSRRHHRLGGASNTPGFPRRDSEEATTYVTANGEVAIKDLRAAFKPTQQQVWSWRTNAPKHTNVRGYFDGVEIGSRTAGRDALLKDCVPAYIARAQQHHWQGSAGECLVEEDFPTSSPRTPGRVPSSDGESPSMRAASFRRC